MKIVKSQMERKRGGETIHSFIELRGMKKPKMFLVFLIIVYSIFSYSDSYEPRIDQDKNADVIKSSASGKFGESFKEKVAFKKILSLGVEDGPDYLMFGRYIIMDTDVQENIFVLDRQKSELYKFDKFGKFVWRTGRKGQGPREIESPNEIKATDDGGIMIVDQGGMLKFFDKNGIFTKTIKLEKPVKSIVTLYSDRILANLVVRGQPGISAAYFNKKGDLIEYFPFRYNFGPKISPKLYYNLGGEFRQYDELIFLCIPDKYEILIFSTDGKNIKKILVDRKLQKSYLKEGNEFVVGDRSGPCFISSNGFMVNRLSIKEENANREYLDFFDSEYHLLGTIPLAKDEYLKKVDSFGNFYFLKTEPFLRLEKYRVDKKDWPDSPHIETTR